MKVSRKGLSIEGIQGHNRCAILAALQDMGACSRKEISVATGLDQATVTRAIGPLIEDGVVEEVGLVRGQRGRRSISLSFSGSGRYILCLRLQRRSFSIAAFNLRGDVLETEESPILRDGSAKQTFGEISNSLDRLIANLKQVDGIGVAVPGPFLERDERVILMTESPQWQGFDLIPELRARYRAASPTQRKRALADFLDDPRDTATPDSMVRLLAKVHRGEALAASATRILLEKMRVTKTGARRLRAPRPPPSRARTAIRNAA